MLRSVAVIALEQVAAFELGVLAEVFGTDRTADGFPGYRFSVCTVDGGPVRSRSGFLLTPHADLTPVEDADLVAVPAHAEETNGPAPVLDALRRHPSVEAVYSPGGGNAATVAAFEKLGRECRVFVAHDLDVDNRRLLREGRISVVLHNDLRADARLAMRLILQQHGALPGEPVRPVPIQVITPYNLPA